MLLVLYFVKLEKYRLLLVLMFGKLVIIISTQSSMP